MQNAVPKALTLEHLEQLPTIRLAVGSADKAVWNGIGKS